MGNFCNKGYDNKKNLKTKSKSKPKYPSKTSKHSHTTQEFINHDYSFQGSNINHKIIPDSDINNYLIDSPLLEVTKRHDNKSFDYELALPAIDTISSDGNGNHESPLMDNTSVYVDHSGPKYLPRQARSISGQSISRHNNSNITSMRKPFVQKQHSQQLQSDSEYEFRAANLDEIQSSLVQKSSDPNIPGDTFCQISLSDHRNIIHSLKNMKTIGRQLKRMLLEESNDFTPQTPMSARRQMSNFLSSPGTGFKASFFAQDILHLDELTPEELREKIENLSYIGLSLMRDLEAKDERIAQLETELATLQTQNK